MAIGTFLYPALIEKLGKGQIDKIDKIVAELNKTRVVVEINLSSGQQSQTTIGGATAYLTQITQDLFQGNELDNLVEYYVYHPNGTMQPARMMTFGYQFQFYTADKSKQGILVSGIPTGTYNDAYYKALKIRLIFNNADFRNI